jgi:hypothetical protein
VEASVSFGQQRRNSMRGRGGRGKGAAAVQGGCVHTHRRDSSSEAPQRAIPAPAPHGAFWEGEIEIRRRRGFPSLHGSYWLLMAPRVQGRRCCGPSHVFCALRRQRNRRGKHRRFGKHSSPSIAKKRSEKIRFSKSIHPQIRQLNFITKNSKE